MDLQDSYKAGSNIFRLWKKDKKGLCDMTDAELSNFEEYLRLYFLLLSTCGSVPVQPELVKRKFLKQILLFSVILLVLFFLFGLK